jgi:hypothetical protein
MKKAIFGFGSGLLLAGVSLAGPRFFDPEHQLHLLWSFCSVFAWPCICFGAWQLARWRGYPGVAGLALFAVGLPLYYFLSHNSHKPIIYILGVAFSAALPILVIRALPQKEEPSFRHHHPKKAKKPEARVAEMIR